MAAALRDRVNAPRPIQQAAYEQSVAAARHALGEATFAAVWVDGERLMLEQALTVALRCDT